MKLTARFLFPVLTAAGMLTSGTGYTQTALRQDQMSPFTWETSLGPKVGLVLSGGGARGIFQIGVLKALEESRIPVDFVVGTSMGSIVGGLYASGYSVADLEILAKTLNWQELLALENEVERSNVFLGQKKLLDRTLITLELDGWKPRIPLAVSSGQKLTTKLNELTLMAPYHPIGGFDRLKIPFRSVATNLATGRKYIFKDGSLMESMRSSMAFPLLFTPYEIGEIRLVDGGVLTNIPADVAREAGCDVVISVDATGTLRPGSDVKAPWHTVDQVVAIMMKLSNQLQLNQSDVVISSTLKEVDGFDFSKLDTVIEDGYRQAKSAIGLIDTLIDFRTHRFGKEISAIVPDPDIRDSLPAGLFTFPVHFQKAVRILSSTGWVQTYELAPADSGFILLAHGFPRISSISLNRVNLLPRRLIEPLLEPVLDRPVNNRDLIRRFTALISVYREAGFPLARIDSFRYEPQTRHLDVWIEEGYVDQTAVTGNTLTRKSTILREANVRPGELFRQEKITSSLDNLSSTDLFQQVSLLAEPTGKGSLLTYRVQEKLPVFLRAGLSASESYHTQYLLNIRNENLFGAGNKLGVTMMGGDRNFYGELLYHSDRILESFFSAETRIGYESLIRLHYDYLFTEKNGRKNPKAILQGETNREVYSVATSLGRQFARYGEIRLELTRKFSKMAQLSGFYTEPDFGENSNHLTTLRLQTQFDSRNDPTMTQTGQFFDFYYENSNERLWSDLTYSKIYARLEATLPFLPRVTLTPRVDLGSADIGLPVQEYFMAGGGSSFYGYREFDLAGRQMFISHLEVRWFTPSTFIFDVILHARYDLGNVWQKQETIKISDMKHGFGFGLTLATPIGPVSVAAGRAFRIYSVPSPDIGLGPVHVYLNIGHSFF